MKWLAVALLVVAGSARADQQTNLSVAWRVCEQHGTLMGRPSAATGPARWAFAPGYGACESIQKRIPSMRSEALDPNKFITDQMLIEKALHDPNGKPE